ncbi:MAG: cation:proton antiporter [Deltaproteobacteria bacterium]|nr:cation:proton antiporter [Deltaproteobacteria bacterium]
MGIAADLIYIVLIALVGGVIAWRFGQPLILGYILAGIAISPHAGGLSFGQAHEIEKLAEIGVALLLFALGLEFSLAELKRLSRIVFIATPIQLVLSALGAFGLAQFFGVSRIEAIWFGAICSLSSTMVVLKVLASRDGLHTQHGRIMFGVLIAQDLAIIPMMLILPQLSGPSIDYVGIASALGKSLAFLAAIYVFGTKIFPRLFAAIAMWGSRELFLLSTLAVALGVGLATYSLGLSFAFGALVAGMMLSETDFNHQALSDISSLRDIFGLLFFVSVGMLFDPSYFVSNITLVLAVTASVIIVKALSAGFAVRIIGFHYATPWLVGLGLAQIGELAFLLSQIGYRSGFISDDTQSMVIAVAVLSMVLTPGLLSFGPSIYRRSYSLLGRDISLAEPKPERIEKRGHVIIVGAGSVGRFITNILSSMKIDHVLIDSDFSTVNDLRDKQNVLFGDASHRAILDAANIQEASLLMSTVTDPQLTIRILAEVRALNPELKIVARVQEIETAEEVQRYNVEEIVEPQREAALQMLRYTLISLGFSEGKIFYLLQQLRGLPSPESKSGDLNDLMRNFAGGRLLEVSLYEVVPNDGIGGRRLMDINIREDFGITVAGILHGDDFAANPRPDFTIDNGDTLALIGTATQINKFKSVMKALMSQSRKDSLAASVAAVSAQD